jgi:hypothetical protein
MFDFSKLGDVTKLANEAKQVQARQQELQLEQVKLLKKISAQLDELTRLVAKNNED